MLPPIPPFDQAPLLNAYRLVLAPESDAVQHYSNCQAQSKAVKDAAVNNVLESRVLGFLFPAPWNLRHILGDTPLTRLATEVASAQGNGEIYDLGRKYIDYFIRSFRNTTVPLRPPSSHPSPPAMDNLEDMINEAMEISAPDHRSTRTRALARDGYHCMFTNSIDRASFHKHNAIKELGKKTGAATRLIQTCSIFNESVLQPNADDLPPPRRRNAEGTLGILKTFGLGDLVERLTTSNPNDIASASGVHDLLNVVSLYADLHVLFAGLNLAFEPTDELNTYDILFTYPEDAVGYFGLKNRVTLTNFAALPRFAQSSSQLEQLPLPDPRLLARQAACVRVAHMSGAARALDELDWEAEETVVLASDGGSANLLMPFCNK
ncbi:hypothetical protein B0H16DRAFT_1336149 [Mycena metata]|uniref:HNH nuclease domain-containing protein n=1 Tax=Mycena metata TaxID=1033252 RepID=A0AAD7HHS5_9AGAR|nr:hypothetical protein B0H16DRAFT_1336149 [Mycena metata]